jgi:hypothetical protein
MMETITTVSQRATLRSGLRTLGLLALLTLGSGIVEQASAGCPQVPAPVKRTANWMSPATSFGGARLMKVGLMTVSEDNQEQNLINDLFRAPIVGLWAFKYLSEGNANKPAPINFTDGYQVDGGNTTWFADGNEITYSGVRDPTSGATCLGIWKRTGEYTYELNHIGLSWNAPGNPAGAPVGPGGPAFIKQHVTLAKDANSYTGTFTISQLGPDGKTLALPGVITGKIVATRVTIDTTTQEP